MAVEKLSAPSGPSDNPTWQGFAERFHSKRLFGVKVIPDPEEIIAEATRLRADPNAVRSSSDRLNDPQVLEAVAGHLRTLIQEAELAQIAAKSRFPEDSQSQLIESDKTYKKAIEMLTGTADNQPDDDGDIPEERPLGG